MVSCHILVLISLTIFFFFLCCAYIFIIVKMKNEDGVDGDVPPTMAIRSLVSTKDAGIIIGKSGKNVSEIREQSGAKVTISEMIPGATERVLTVSGPLDTVAKVIKYSRR